MINNSANLNDILVVRAYLLEATRSFFNTKFGLEVTTPTIVGITGACENIDTLFKLQYFDKTKYLSQTGQLHLEYIVKTINKKCWTIARSFRAEPIADNRHLTEFSLIEFEGIDLKLKDIMAIQENFIIYIIAYLLNYCQKNMLALGADIEYLKTITEPFNKIEYKDAIELLNSQLGYKLNYGDNLSFSEETSLLNHFDNKPLFLTMFPSEIKFFNMKRTDDNKEAYSVDLLLPPLGEASGGAEREANLDKLKNNLLESNMYKNLSKVGSTLEDFEWYFNLLKNRSCSTGGTGVGYERLLCFLLNQKSITRY